MIAQIHGTVLTLSANDAVINVGGVGLRILATPTTLSSLRVGAEATVSTSLVVREDSLTLYGFADEDEKETFEILLGLSGIGPRIALAILAVHTPDALRKVVAQESLAALTQVPGIGKKGAQRILLELGNKLGPVRGESYTQPTDSTVTEALVGLGWNESDASAAVAQVEAEQGMLPTSEMLRHALRKLGGRS